MAITIKHNKSTKVIPTKDTKCRASHITDIFSSDAWKDKTCFIIGGGPSLENFDFGHIRNELTIGINKAFVKFPCTINYSMDPRFYDRVTYGQGNNAELHQQWLAHKGVKLFLRRSMKSRFDSSVYIVKSLLESALSLDLKKGIWPGNNSGFGALMLACALGCKRIGLLGYDLKIQQKSKNIVTHWHGGYGNEKKDTYQEKLDKFRACFEGFADVITEQDIEVVNLVEKNEDSALECFTKDSLDNFLSKRDVPV